MHTAQELVDKKEKIENLFSSLKMATGAVCEIFQSIFTYKKTPFVPPFWASFTEQCRLA